MMTLIRDIGRGLRPDPLLTCWLVVWGAAFAVLVVR